MAVSAHTIRIILRWVHLILGVVLLCYIYSPFGERYPVFRAFVKFAAVPIIVFSGIWIWKFKAFNKIFGIR